MTVRRRALGGAALLACALLASCAPPPRPGTALAELQARYGAARTEREGLLHALTADVLLRADGRATGKLPALPATLQLAAPDRLRLQVSGILGIAADVVVSPESLWIWVPSQRMALHASVDSLKLGAPVPLVACVLGATWDPPAEAWRAAASDSSGWRLGWREGRDSLALRVDADGQPTEAWRGRDDVGVRVRYDEWQRVHGVTFPARCDVADDSGWAQVRLRLDEVTAQARPDSAWFAPRHRGNVRWLEWDELRTMFDGGGFLR